MSIPPGDRLRIKYAGAFRQLADRAREAWDARRPRYRTDPRVRRQVAERFITAVTGGDVQALIQVLAPDVTLWADGGGKARAAGSRPVRGRDRIARLIVGDAVRRPIAAIAHFKPILPPMARAGVPESWLTFPIGTLKLAGAVGLLLGLAGVPLVGAAAAIGLILFFVCALYTHIRASDYSSQFGLACGFLALAVAAPALGQTT